MGSVLRRPRLGQGQRRLAEPLGRCPAAGLGLSAALKIAAEPGSWENIGIQHGQLALTGAGVSAGGPCVLSQVGCAPRPHPAVPRKDSGPMRVSPASGVFPGRFP